MKYKNKKRKKKIYEEFDEEPESDETFAYIAGYTEWGFPYGIIWEEMEEIEKKEAESHKDDCNTVDQSIDESDLPF